MQLYDAKVRLAGLVNNEVRKFDTTAAEIMILREIHGSDSVVDITAGKMDKRQHAVERERLKDIYCNKQTSTPETYTKKVAMFRGLFGADSADLPVKLDEDVPSAARAKAPDAASALA